AAHWWRRRGDNVRQPRIELPGGHPPIPRREGGAQDGRELPDGAAGAGGEVDPLGPALAAQLTVGFPAERPAAVLVDEVPFVEGEHECAAGLDDGADDA